MAPRDAGRGCSLRGRARRAVGQAMRRTQSRTSCPRHDPPPRFPRASHGRTTACTDGLAICRRRAQDAAAAVGSAAGAPGSENRTRSSTCGGREQPSPAGRARDADPASRRPLAAAACTRLARRPSAAVARRRLAGRAGATCTAPGHGWRAPTGAPRSAMRIPRRVAMHPCAASDGWTAKNKKGPARRT
jgi:hypothetical protein